MEIANARIEYEANLSAVLIHADGSRSDLGIISAAGRKVREIAHRSGKFFRRTLRLLGYGAALALLALNAREGLLLWHVPICFGLVTTVGVNYMASDFASGGSSPTISGMKYHDSGTGTGAESTGDSALGTATGNARVSGTPSNPSANIYQSVATLPYTGSAAITEWGIFSASSSGTLWDRRKFSAINVVNGDSIQFTYKLTIAAGGS